MDNNKITIGFTYTSEFGDTFSQSTTTQLFPELGLNDITTIGEQMNAFLKQCGFIMEHDTVLLESLSVEEVDLVQDFIRKIREHPTKEE